MCENLGYLPVSSVTRLQDHGNAEIAGLDIAGLDNDGRMYGRLTELKLQNFIP